MIVDLFISEGQERNRTRTEDLRGPYAAANLLTHTNFAKQSN